MLGLGGAVSSGSTPEPKYSITLDGADDYVDLGTAVSLGAGDFSISLWVKTDDFHNKFFISEYVDAEDNWYFRGSDQDPPTLQFFHEISDTATTIYLGSSISLDNHKNAWTHIAITADRNGKVIGYVNGVADDADKNGDTTNLTTTANTLIGRYHNDYSDIQVDEVSIWDASLSQASVESLYNNGKPANISITHGAAFAITAHAWYRMGNGSFDDKANGAIHDQHNPGFGADLVTNGDFAADSTWSKGTGMLIEDGVCKFNGNQNAQLSQNIGLVTGAVYKAKFTISNYVSGELDVNIGGNTRQGNYTANGTYEVVEISSTGNNLFFQEKNDSGGFVGHLDNVSVKRLNGLPGLTSGGPTFSSDTP